ncbi:MAG: segregation/condensation protein A [Sphingobacteriales bacterium]|jgi:segregation and condensation protein A|nr:segregation/condensation protein A [Sphingobacteriales bacterium]
MNWAEKFEIRLPQFEGPFDLLLFFIERDELDIYDIPIATITKDFLTYIEQMTALNIELASEFILVAARLMQIKARMLLPRPEIDEEGNEVDPRKDLVQKLLEYKKFKEASAEMEVMLDERAKQFSRGNIANDLIAVRESATQEDELQTLDLYRLLTVYHKVINRFVNKPEEVRHTVIQYPYTIEDQKKHLSDLLITNDRLDFESVMLNSKDRVQLVYSFLAILEMLQQQMIKIQIGLGYNNFWISTRAEGEEVVYEPEE